MARVAVAAACAFVGTLCVPGIASAAPAAQKWAVVNADGNLARGLGVNGAVKVVTGTYVVDFASKMTKCAYEATVGGTSTGPVADPVVATVARRTGDPNGVQVQTFDTATAMFVDAPFHLTTYCGPKLDYAVVGADGSLARGAHVVASKRAGPGVYHVVFDHNITKCVFLATVGTTGGSAIANPGGLTVADMSGNKNGVFVRSMDVNAGSLDSSFHLAVDCGATRDIGVIDVVGTKIRGTHVVSASELGADSALYEVVFDRDVSLCAYTATIGTGDSSFIDDPGVITTATRGGNPSAVFLETHEANGRVSGYSFHIEVTC